MEDRTSTHRKRRGDEELCTPGSVQFYETDKFLCASISMFILAGFENKEAVIIIATQEHCQGIEKRLLAMNVDVPDCQARGQLILLSAEDVMQKFMVNGLPDRDKFFTTVVSDVDGALSRFTKLRVFGEVVNILLGAGNLDGTLALEKLWNELTQTRTFFLMCGYAIDKFKDYQHSKTFQEVCRYHGRVIPAESYVLLNHDAQLRLIADLQQKAIALQSEIAQHQATELELRRRETDLKKATKELKKAKEIAEAANKSKSDFLANMSHELRTPLTAIIGFAELVLDSEVNTEAIDAAQVIMSNGKQLTTLLNDILNLAKVESGQVEVERIYFSVNDIILDLRPTVELLAQEKGISLRFQFIYCNPLSITSDPTRLRQILLNVVGNAIKFTDKGSVDVVFRIISPLVLGGSMILECTIKDTGIGITPDQAKLLFQPFVQANCSTSRLHGGSGLGLSLARQYARLLGGDLYLAESTPGKGSTFVLTIDAGQLTDIHSAQSQTNTKIEALPPTSFTLPKEKIEQYPVSILVVDDNVVNRALLLHALEKVGYRDITSASDGLQAINAATERHFDIIFLDIQMPNMDGFTACQAIRKLYNDQRRAPQPVIIALTAHAMYGYREKCLASGMDDYISKPFDFPLLFNKLVYWSSSVARNRRSDTVH